MPTKTRILIIQNSLLHYRIPLYEFLNRQEGYELCVAFPYGEIVRGTTFRQIKLQVQKAGPFILHQGLYDLCCQYDVVIAMFNIRWLTHLKLAWRMNRSFGFVYWGIGVSTECGFNVTRRYDPIRYLFAHRADAMLFYSDFPVEKYRRAGIDARKLFVAPNTVETVLPAHYSDRRRASRKNKLIFIGSLQNRKNLGELLDCFADLASEHNLLTLHIVGEGEMRQPLEAQVRAQQLKTRVIFHGQINEDSLLAEIFADAVACVSPGQAGLSVLKSFSFGVPFITSATAITGGERFAIHDNWNGLLYPARYPDLATCLNALLEDPEKVEELSEAAFASYWPHRTIPVMAAGFTASIKYALARHTT